MIQSSDSSTLGGDGDLERQKTEAHDGDPEGHLPELEMSMSKVKGPQSLFKEVVFVAVICMAQLITQAVLGQAVVPLHIIGRSFGTTNPGQLSWYAAAYSLTVGTFILPAGRLGDVFGHKRFFIAGFLWLALWSLLAGFSAYSNQIFFACCRAFQGIGPALLLPNAIAILGRTYEPGRRKDMIFSLFGATAPGGFVIGGVFSALFAEKVWWPWGYWVTAMVSCVLALLGVLVIPHTPTIGAAGEGFMEVFSRLDGLGAITGVVGLVLINFAWNQGPVVGWPTPYVYVLLIVGFLFIAAFVYVEAHAKHPLVPVGALSKDVGFVLACIGAGWSSFGIWMFYTWQMVEVLRGVSPLLASAQFSPVAISGLVAALTTGVLLSHVRTSVVMLFSLVAFTVGSIIASTTPVHQTYWAQTFVSLLIMPWGMDMSFPAATILLSNAMEKKHQGLAASLVNTVVNYSISIGLGFAGTIETQIDSDGTHILKGYRGAYYMGIGLSGGGVIIAILFVLYHHLRDKKQSS
ncbi:hypothetical protein F5884DRAFT_794875 [Xylogone sp. PMI_703]|nr:hypothetical protein F5884DRAFT_794875 [Xylogone sp. PMI_703]